MKKQQKIPSTSTIRKRLLSILMAVIMTMGYMPTMAWAEGETEGGGTVSSATFPLTWDDGSATIHYGYLDSSNEFKSLDTDVTLDTFLRVPLTSGRMWTDIPLWGLHIKTNQ